MPRKMPKPSQPFAAIIAAGLIVAGLFLAKDFLIPFAFAVLLAFLLAPLANRLERLKLGRIPSVLIAVVVMLLPLVGLVALMGNQILEVNAQLPSYKTNLSARVKTLSQGISSQFAKLEKTVKEIENEAKQPDAKNDALVDADKTPHPRGSADDPSDALIEKERKSSPDPVLVRIVDQPSLEDLSHWISPVLSPLGMLAVVSVLVLFILLEREDLRNRAILLVGRSHLPIATKAIDEAGTRVSNYLRMQLLVNAIYGAVVGLTVALLGLPNPLFWAVAGMALRFIPYIGPWVTAGGIFLISLAATDGWSIPAIVVSSIALLELVVNNVLEPWLYGSSAGLSSVGVIAAAMFWTWLWGAPGLFLSTPLTVCICVLGRYFPQFEFAAILLSDNPPLPAESRFYQRLLAVDDVEVKQVVNTTLKEEGLGALFENLLLPTLSQAEKDFQSGDLDDDQRSRVYAALLNTAEEAVWQQLAGDDRDDAKATSQSPPAVAPTKRRPIICVPGQGVADQMSTQLIAEYLAAHYWESQTTSDATLCSEVLQQVAESEPEAVLISTIATFVGAHARYLCKRLRQRFPNTPLIIGLWAGEGADLTASTPGKSADWQLVVHHPSDLTAWLENRSVPARPSTAQTSPAVAVG